MLSCACKSGAGARKDADAHASGTRIAPSGGDPYWKASVRDVEVNPAAGEASNVDRSEIHRSAPVRRNEHEEGWFTRSIEQQTAKIPSSAFLTAALLAMGTSLTLELVGRRRESRFVGMWPPTLLIMGVYNKVVKTLGSR
jgi:hypothetical protein